MYHELAIGMRVYHRRHSFQVGTVVGGSLSPSHVYVMWDSFWYERSVLEPLSALRATPVQPTYREAVA